MSVTIPKNRLKPETHLMNTRRLVVLYGDSVFLEGIALDLKNQPTMDVLTLAVDEGEAVQRLAALRPEVIIYDLAQSPGDWALPLLPQCPNLRLIGLDMAAEQALVVSGAWSAAASLQDLAALIEQTQAPHAPPEILEAEILDKQSKISPPRRRGR
jgi:DNA-binding NarL/FixJ family response regulator